MTNTLTTMHPSHYLPERILSELRSLAPAAEAMQQLHPRQLEIIYEHNWFKMFVPIGLNGSGLTLPGILRREEALAWADGSTAWVVTLCSGAGWFAGFLDKDLSAKLFSDPKVCLAGSGAATGTAEILEGGFLISGEWKYASGAIHATAFTANCILTQDDKPVVDNSNKPIVRSFVFLRDEVTLLKNWRTMGMIATGSHGFSVDKLHVTKDRQFQINDARTNLSDPVYRYPFLQLAEATLAVNFSGMALQFLDLCRIACDRSTNRSFQYNPVALLHQANTSMNHLRTQFYENIETSWSYCSRGENIPDDVLRIVSDLSFRLYQNSLKLVAKVYPLLGLRGADPNNEANRVFRNIFTASQHTLFSTRGGEDIGNGKAID